MSDSVTIRVWKGRTVVGLFTVSPTGHTSYGAVGGASNSTRADIELDPWANLVVDNRPQFSTPTSIRAED